MKKIRKRKVEKEEREKVLREYKERRGEMNEKRIRLID